MGTSAEHTSCPGNDGPSARGSRPPLIRVFGHRYLVGEPLVTGNPVLSMYGADVIVYADDLASFLAAELAGQQTSLITSPRNLTVPPAPIPFWQEVIEGMSLRFESQDSAWQK